jgi:hypothetical protein
VDQFQLTVLGESLWVSRESGSVPTVVSWELSVQVAWHSTLRERSQEEWALRSIPLRLGRAGWLGLRTNKALLFRFLSRTWHHDVGKDWWVEITNAVSLFREHMAPSEPRVQGGGSG